MRDLAENIAVLDTLAALQRTATEYNGGEIDLADHGYPRKILVVVSAGLFGSGASLNLDIESGEVSGALTDEVIALDEMDEAGNQIYEYKPKYRYINIELTIADEAVDCAVVLVMEHCRFGGRGSDD